MYRGILIALLSGVILFAFAALPPMLPGSTTGSLFGSAQAQKTTPTTDAINLNSSRSNNQRMGGGGGAKQQTKQSNANGGPGFLAVSDPGVPNDPKPSKPKTK